MDSDSPVKTRTAGQPTLDIGARFTAGNTRKGFTRARRTVFGADSVRRPPGRRGSPACRHPPVGHGYRP
jgi:hypothetical protein